MIGTRRKHHPATPTTQGAPGAAEPGPVEYPPLDIARPAIPDDTPDVETTQEIARVEVPETTVVRDWRNVLGDRRLPPHLRYERAAQAMIPDALTAAADTTLPYTDPEGAAWRLHNALTQYQAEIAARRAARAAGGVGITPSEAALIEAREQLGLPTGAVDGPVDGLVDGAGTGLGRGLDALIPNKRADA